MSFMIFQNQKTTFQPIKTTSPKSRQIDIFPKGLTHGFSPKMAIFFFFFQQIQARIMSFLIFQNEKTLFQAINTRSLKSRKIDIIFSTGVNPWFWSKNGHFTNLFFYAIYARKMSFIIFQNQKTLFVGYKNKKFKKPKN